MQRPATASGRKPHRRSRSTTSEGSAGRFCILSQWPVALGSESVLGRFQPSSQGLETTALFAEATSRIDLKRTAVIVVPPSPAGNREYHFLDLCLGDIFPELQCGGSGHELS